MTSHQERNQERIQLQVHIIKESGCWQWQGQISNTGYGRVMINTPNGPKTQSAHIASYEAFVDPIPNGSFVRHTCNNRLCVNPEHMLLAKANTR